MLPVFAFLGMDTLVGGQIVPQQTSKDTSGTVLLAFDPASIKLKRTARTSLARASVRPGSHDAGAWSTSSTFGGADGSVRISADETRYGAGAAGLAQFMHNVTTVVNSFKIRSPLANLRPLSAHTLSASNSMSILHELANLDSTPGAWDLQFYHDVISSDPPRQNLWANGLER
ncbi:hypothetical protein BBP40_011186 [Aspergillus hancockii]|nr:hypothetical protein BBP40_011186 [Aspergillus hancockii]